MYRKKTQQNIFGGVCLGLAEYFNADVTLVRILFVLLFFTPIPIGTAYLLLWAFLPVKEGDYVVDNSNDHKINFNIDMKNQNRNGNILGGLILIVLGIIFSFKTFLDINIFAYLKNLWPLVFIALGAWIILKERDKNTNSYKDDNNNFDDSGSF